MIKIASKFQFPPCFSYYLILLKDMRLGREPSYTLIHSAGGRNFGKTYCFTLFCTYLFYYKIPVIIYAFRKQQNEVTRTIWEEFDNRFTASGIEVKKNKSSFTITSLDGNSKIMCTGLYSPLGKKVVLKGLAVHQNKCMLLNGLKKLLNI